MKVTLISHTPDALNLLLGTKNTRLGVQENPASWSESKKQEHLDYMRDTIKSSWEFVDYVFEFEGVTRAFAQQLERTRSGSYAEKSLRAVDASHSPIATPAAIAASEETLAMWDDATAIARGTYAMLVANGISLQDARGVLPLNVETGLKAKFNLRTLHDMAKVRLCTRTQGEYQTVFRAMRNAVIEVHPWAAEFIEVHCVAVGTCAFPRYGKEHCPLYDNRMDLSALRDEVREKFWASPIVESNPAQV